MCLAIVVPEKTSGIEIPLKHVENAWESNSDGAGIMYATDKKRLVVIKGIMSLDELKEKYYRLRDAHPDSKFCLHLRYASLGKVKESNTHPFKVNKNLAVIHNGTIRHINATVNGSDSDTKIFAEEYLSKLPNGFMNNIGYKRLISNFIGSSKLVMMNNHGNVSFINENLGETVDGIWYSADWYKDNVKRSKGGVKVVQQVKTERKETKTNNDKPTCKCGAELAFGTEIYIGKCYRCMDDRDKIVVENTFPVKRCKVCNTELSFFPLFAYDSGICYDCHLESIETAQMCF